MFSDRVPAGLTNQQAENRRVGEQYAADNLHPDAGSQPVLRWPYRLIMQTPHTAQRASMAA